MPYNNKKNEKQQKYKKNLINFARYGFAAVKNISFSVKSLKCVSCSFFQYELELYFLRDKTSNIDKNKYHKIVLKFCSKKAKKPLV